MKLHDVLIALGVEALQGDVPEHEVYGITADSRRVSPGDIFVTISGARFDAHQFIPQAIERGAVAVVAQRPVPVPPGVALAVVEDTRHALSALAAQFYGNPSSRVKVVGITGTNGKTTVSYLIKSVVEAAGRLPGVIGTAGMMLGDEVIEAKSGYTTPEAHTVQRLLAQMVQQGAEVAAMEVTSHALEQHRVAHCRFDVAVYTNLSHEHLDYHGDMESYCAAKAKLFTMLEPGACAVVNLDDPYGLHMATQVREGVQVLTYGFAPEALVRAEQLELNGTGVRYLLVTPAGETWVEAPYLFGAYNVSNALAAIATGLALGYDLSDCVAAMRTATGAPGRFQPVDLGQDFTVVVDYAHTPDGFEKLLSDVARIRRAGARIISVFGSAGHRDQTKRPDMGRIAGHYSDVLILTEEDPRTEDATEISRQIAAGVQRPGVDVVMVEDRLAAIEQAIHMAEPHDIVLILGKGNETELEVQHPTEWAGDVPAAEGALKRLLEDSSRRRRVTA